VLDNSDIFQVRGIEIDIIINKCQRDQQQGAEIDFLGQQSLTSNLVGIWWPQKHLFHSEPIDHDLTPINGQIE
jgi:hypothetical protein